jgi:hypothetical protein
MPAMLVVLKRPHLSLNLAPTWPFYCILIIKQFVPKQEFAHHIPVSFINNTC